MTVTHARTAGSASTASTAGSASTARAARVVDEAEIKRRIAFADAALGAAGHEVTDPEARETARQIAAGTLTADEAVAHHIAGLNAQ